MVDKPGVTENTKKENTFPKSTNGSKKEQGINRVAFLVFGAGLACIGLGLYREEAYVVLQKAIHICLECIGIG